MLKQSLLTLAILVFKSVNAYSQIQGNQLLTTPGSVISSTINVDYNDRFLSPTKFGSNSDVNDHQQVGERLFDERIFDRGFEWTQNNKWSSILNGASASFMQDNTEQFAGNYSLKSIVTSATFSGPALVIPGIWIESGKKYLFSFWAKGISTGGITINLLDPKNFSSIIQSPLNFTGFSGVWSQFSDTLTVNKSEVNGLLTLLYTDAGTLWLDQLSITPLSNTANHISPDLSTAIADLGLKVMRFPGESNVYDWQKAIGPRDKRNVSRPLISYYKANAGAGYEKQPLYNDFGIDECLQMADSYGWMPIMRVNMIAGSITASNLVEYCNGSVSTTYGAQRAANGHAAPYNVKYWEIGNEIWNQIAPEPGAIYDSVGFTQANTDKYIDSLITFSKAMKSIDPSIKIGAVGGQKPSDSYLTNIVDPDWNEDILARAAVNIDFFGNHCYAPGPDPRSLSPDTVYNGMMGESLFFERELNKLKTSIAGSANPSIQICVSEYGVSPADINNPLNDAKNMQSVLWLASMKNTLLRQKIELSAQFDLLNESGSLLFHGQDTVNNANNEIIIKSGPALLEMLYKDYLKSSVIPVTVTSDLFSSTALGWMPGETSIPMLEAVASTDETKGVMTVFVVNRNKDADVTANISIASFPGILKFDTGAVVQGASSTSLNSISNPNAIFRTPVLNSDVIPGSSYFTTTFKKASVTCLQFSFNPLGITGNINDNGFGFYPNPCSTSFKLSINNINPGTIQIYIINLLGQVIYNDSEMAMSEQFCKEFEINIPNGTYFIKLQNDDKIHARKIIIEN